MSRTLPAILSLLLSFPPVSLAQSPALSTQQSELSGSDTQQNSFFGYSLAVSGNTLVVGAPGYPGQSGNFQDGSAYLFVKPVSGWTNTLQTAELSPSDKDYLTFGFSVAIAGNTVFVAGDGKVYVYVEPPGGWQNMTETAVIRDPEAGDGFGYAVGVDSTGDTLFVAAPYASQSAIGGGAAYIFRKPRSGWISTATPNAVLTESNAQPFDEMGTSIAVGGNTVVVGAAVQPANLAYGAAYVFVKPPSGWTNATETAKLTASNPGINAELGTSVAISGKTIITGAPGPNPVAGTAYVFAEPPGSWKSTTETARLGSAHHRPDGFGASVSILGSRAVVGASLADVGSSKGQGAAYFFIAPPAGWKSTDQFSYEFTDQYGVQNDGLGFSVALQGNALFAGAPFAYNLANVGLAFVFAIQQ